ncbi:DUF1120 domain-containing protein [Leclercia adecarboxylata]|uniref:DUF1120 domain-containing protein n=1 Tax=Leclercia adecarboxylata TaxID=83655 RepID=A0ABU6I551_9ENTR|nr:DUF1120 domain-containing protein [Leclercia adecarboxylata]MBZ3802255.1 DUF1120 domain-containing protein [Leclercia adecarboxylata]MBZ3806885.1 DUF1120 domain-containing protein [Leclercia adecarboxylata]MDV5239576.1 DUF1120 domain-containing protein [Leclercia adecarboxylata]MDV5276139.1 DUF1120 domain-containing protein [Leclercia adecarboxylata]MDV5461277.1 DUF1120 domain-containing protein [Leclercia adecarboxylata]
MKKVILATAIALCTTSAFAGETAELKVKGLLTNSACSVEMDKGGVINYGTIHLGTLSADKNNVLGQNQLPVSITCTAATKVGFTITDNHTDSNARLPVDVHNTPDVTDVYYTYGVGKTTGGVKIGNYSMWMTDVTADGNTVDPIVQNQDWTDGHWVKGSVPRSDTFATTSFAATGTKEPIAITNATFNFVTNLVIQGTNTLAITDDTPFEGQATMTLVYL